MAMRGQITGAKVEGPFAMDNAISKKSAGLKGIFSDVAGDADILVFPDLESGNIYFKSRVIMSDAALGGVVVGGKVPIILNSRSARRRSARRLPPSRSSPAAAKPRGRNRGESDMTDKSPGAKPETILVINAGSSSIKYGLYRADDLTLLDHKNIETKKAGGYEPAMQQILDLIATHNVTASATASCMAARTMQRRQNRREGAGRPRGPCPARPLAPAAQPEGA